jgi:hypothetical protein
MIEEDAVESDNHKNIADLWPANWRRRQRLLSRRGSVAVVV